MVVGQTVPEISSFTFFRPHRAHLYIYKVGTMGPKKFQMGLTREPLVRQLPFLPFRKRMDQLITNIQISLVWCDWLGHSTSKRIRRSLILLISKLYMLISLEPIFPQVRFLLFWKHMEQRITPSQISKVNLTILIFFPNPA